MLKNILFACAFSSLISMSTFADEAVSNPTIAPVVIEEDTQAPVLAMGSFRLSSEEEAPALPVEEELLASCPCKNKDKNKEISFCTECDKEDKVPVLEDSAIACACGKCNGRHLIASAEKVENETVLPKVIEEEAAA